jgi:Icc protein
MDITIAHLSDLHVGAWHFVPEKLEICVEEVNELEPDLVAITGDITVFGFEQEYELAKKYLGDLHQKILVVPGNHDVRYCGDKYFDKYFGYGNKVMKISDELTVVGVDSSVPDLDEGTVGRGKQRWLRKELQKIPEGVCKVVAIHHHLIPIPDTGRERSILTDSGDVLKLLIEEGVNVVLCGHRHTPYLWLLENLPILVAGSTSSEKLRAHIKNSYNIIKITDNGLKIKLREIGGEERKMGECKWREK